MNKDIQAYNDAQSAENKEIFDTLSREINLHLPEVKKGIHKT
jgi:hypothetical protein